RGFSMFDRGNRNGAEGAGQHAVNGPVDGRYAMGDGDVWCPKGKQVAVRSCRPIVPTFLSTAVRVRSQSGRNGLNWAVDLDIALSMATPSSGRRPPSPQGEKEFHTFAGEKS